MELLVCAGLISTVGASVLMASTIGEGIDGGAKQPTNLEHRECREDQAPAADLRIPHFLYEKALPKFMLERTAVEPPLPSSRAMA